MEKITDKGIHGHDFFLQFWMRLPITGSHHISSLIQLQNISNSLSVFPKHPTNALPYINQT